MSIITDIYIYLVIMFKRTLEKTISERFFQGKAILLIGPRQVGKTTLLQTVLANKDHLFLNGDDPTVRGLLTNPSTTDLKALIGSYRIVFIDEAQRMEGIGLTMKLITDQFKDVQLLASGSSAWEINQKTQEPLTGRKFEYNLYPISWEEFESQVGFLEASQQLEERLVYGMYPDVLNNRSNAREVLQQLASSYLYQDVLSFMDVRKPEILDKLLRALALQVGSEVSFNELAGLLGIDKITVSRYIDLLEKSFIVFTLPSFSRNQRNEIKHNRKIYFYDNGIRNAVINNFNPLEWREDKGALWENFLIVERMKMHKYHQRYARYYFWRTVQKQEIDWVEEIDGRLFAYEFKWKSTSRNRIPASFLTTYSANGQLIDRQNFREFLQP